MATVEIDLGDGTTVPMTPPTALGAAFAAVVAEAVSWDEQRRATVQATHEAATPDLGAYWEVVDNTEDALMLAGVNAWSCAFGVPEEQPIPTEAGPYIRTLRDKVCSGAADVASAVLARDLGLVTETDFQTITGWWTTAGLPLPAARDGAAFAADWDQIRAITERIAESDHYRENWPLATA